MSDPQRIEKARDEIAQTRAALAETTAALAVKADVKSRLRAAAKQHQTVLAAGAGAVVLLVAVRFRNRKKGRRNR